MGPCSCVDRALPYHFLFAGPAVDDMPADELKKLVLHLRDSLRAREVQLERKFEEVATMQEVTHKLMVTLFIMAFKCHFDTGSSGDLAARSFL